MIVLFLSRRSAVPSGVQLRIARILPHLTLTQGFQSVCGVLKTAVILLTIGYAAHNPAHAQGLRVQEKVVTDPWTGAAIGGFDPVAYFVDQRAVPGSPDHLAVESGVAWRFASPGNLAAFLDSPESYRPSYGGYDPVMVASGIPVAGSPQLFAVIEGRLYLFRTDENRQRFIGNEKFRTEAERMWPELQWQLAP